MNKPRQTLSLDLDQLFPGETFEIGEQSIMIRPLSLAQIAEISKKMKGFGSTLLEEGVTWENYNEAGSMFKIASVILINFPEILEEAANLEIECIKILPLEIIVSLVNKIIEVNLQSKEELAKNFNSLTKKFMEVMPAEDAEKEIPKAPKTPLKKIKKT